MTRARQQLGKAGEEIALRYLQNLGMTLLQKNYRVRTGEIDLVMWDKDVLVFVEVRTKNNDRCGTPVETVIHAKRRKIVNTARHFLKENRIDDEIRCRFDLVGIVMRKDLQPEVEYLENAFFVGE